MTDTFSYNAPSISPGYSPKASAWSTSRPTSSGGLPSSYPTLNRHQPTSVLPLDHPSGASPSDDEDRLPTPMPHAPLASSSGRLSNGRPSGQFSRGHSPGTSSHAPPSSHFPNSYGQHSGVNTRNTRPMTAPSSISQPYFTSHYSPSAPPVSSSFYSPSHHFASQAPIHRPFQYQVDSQPQMEQAAYRGRHFSVPDLVGGSDGSEGLPDEPRYGTEGPRMGITSNSPPSTFLYGAPALLDSVSHPTSYYPSHSGSSPEQSDHHSRPTTGDSLSSSSTSHTSRPPPFDPLRRGYPPGGDLSQHDNASNNKVYNFIAQAGQTTKRPRRRYDEIERLYTCDYPGCQKAYGTLNHLNSHKTMQKHGPKSTPAQFKELRKAWRDGKKAAAAATARQPPGGDGPGGERARIRPSTSAGEYQYHAPAPFMSSLGTPIPNYPLPSAPLAPASHFPLAALHPPPAGWGGVYVLPSYEPHGPSYASSSPHRPMTAPSYYSTAPSFGFNHHPPEQQPRHAPINFSLPERRLSLPALDAGGHQMSSHGNFAFSPADGGFASILEEPAYPLGAEKVGSEGVHLHEDDRRHDDL